MKMRTVFSRSKSRSLSGSGLIGARKAGRDELGRSRGGSSLSGWKFLNEAYWSTDAVLQLTVSKCRGRVSFTHEATSRDI